MPMRGSPQSAPIFGTFGLIVAWVLVHSYFFHCVLFCIASSIVLQTGQGYTQSFK